MVRKPTSTITLLCFAGARPEELASTSYMPGRRWMMAYLPLASATAASDVAVAEVPHGNRRPGITAPDVSLMVPPMAPSVIDCAKPMGARPTAMVSAVAARNSGLQVFREMLIPCKPFRRIGQRHRKSRFQ